MFDRIMRAHCYEGAALGFTLAMLAFHCAVIGIATVLLAKGRPELLLAYVAAMLVIKPLLSLSLKLVGLVTAYKTRGTRLAAVRARRLVRSA